MSKPTVRVLALLELLQSNGQLSGSELARRLEVDGRCVAISSPSRSWAYPSRRSADAMAVTAWWPVSSSRR